MSTDAEKIIEVNTKLAQVIGFIIDLLEIAGERLDALEKTVAAQQDLTFEDLVSGAPQIGLTEDQRTRLKEIMKRISAGVQDLSKDG